MRLLYATTNTPPCIHSVIVGLSLCEPYSQKYQIECILEGHALSQPCERGEGEVPEELSTWGRRGALPSSGGASDTGVVTIPSHHYRRRKRGVCLQKTMNVARIKGGATCFAARYPYAFDAERVVSLVPMKTGVTCRQVQRPKQPFLHLSMARCPAEKAALCCTKAPLPLRRRR